MLQLKNNFIVIFAVFFHYVNLQKFKFYSVCMILTVLFCWLEVIYYFPFFEDSVFNTELFCISVSQNLKYLIHICGVLPVIVKWQVTLL